jgi:uncharacterized protein (TIGR01244 family)
MDLSILFAVVAGVTPACPIPKSTPDDSIPNYTVLEPCVAAAGQPSADALGKLKALGFKTVINLRPVEEAPVVAEEERIVEAQGLRYVSVPVTPATFSAHDVESVRKVLEEPGIGPVLLHCASSNRVGAVWGLLARQRGRTLQEAEAEANRAGISSEAMKEAFRKLATEVHSAKP